MNRSKLLREARDNGFDGETFDPAQDGERLTGQLGRVFGAMRGGRWLSLGSLAVIVVGSEGGVAARLRDLRKERFGGWEIERKRSETRPGLWLYRLNGKAQKPEAQPEPQDRLETCLRALRTIAAGKGAENGAFLPLYARMVTLAKNTLLEVGQ